MLSLLPLIALLLGGYALAHRFPHWGWRQTFVRTTVLAGAYMILATELLSLFDGVTRLGLVSVWALPVLAGIFWLAGWRRRKQRFRWPELRLAESRLDRLLLLGVVAIALITALVAWLAPPNTWDSLTYHMSRVAHWADHASLRPYPTGIPRQILMSPGAEIAVLQTYVLLGGDRLANFVQWFAMLSSLIAASLIAARLGAKASGQLLAAVFGASLPMGIAQATSTMTDYVTTLWVLAVALEVVNLARTGSIRESTLFAGLAAGLGVVTKPIAIPYLLPLAVFAAILIYRRRSLAITLAAGVAAALLALSVNAGYLGRNLTVFGSPLGSQDRIDTHANRGPILKVLVSNALRNASLQAGTPWPTVNQFVYRGVMKVHYDIDQDVMDPGTSVHPVFEVWAPSRHEARAGNPFQAYLSALVFILVALRWRRLDRLVLAYGLVIIASFLLFSLAFQFTVFGSRYHMPLFLLLGPLVGVALPRLTHRVFAQLVGLAMIVLAWQWLVSLDTRPLLPLPGDPPSLLEAPREAFFFPTSQGHLEVYKDLVSRIQAQQCTEIGLMLYEDSAEYPFWALLGAPKSGARLEWIVSGTPLAAFSDPEFAPCAIICNSCSAADTRQRGLPHAVERQGIRLYLEESDSAAR